MCVCACVGVVREKFATNMTGRQCLDPLVRLLKYHPFVLPPFSFFFADIE